MLISEICEGEEMCVMKQMKFRQQNSLNEFI